ncbi:hypothetical protein ACFS5N_10700 [Mucilaginibacter ximonensis]|uniref:Lipoprotein n=1 Tax=Mucilaginibacter ximonensis TaxID=538021 RepID=A0ABW5YC14_9SPHI
MKRLLSVPIFAILSLSVILLSSCHTKTKPAENAAKSAPNIKAPQRVPDSLAGIVGNYRCKCQTGNNYIELTVEKVNDGFNAKVSYFPDKFKASGVLKPDTNNFDPDFRAWSFTTGKDIYGFQFSRTQDNKWHLVMINEDYKKVFKECSDAKVIVFESTNNL